MREIISVIVMLMALWGGSKAAEGIYHAVQRAALEKAARGLPSLSGLMESIRKSSDSSGKR